jgi:hypothetical protein
MGKPFGFPPPIKIIRSAQVGVYRRQSATIGGGRRREKAKKRAVLKLAHENQTF